MPDTNPADRQITVQIDEHSVSFPTPRVSGRTLRAAIQGTDVRFRETYDLYLESPGLTADRLVLDGDVFDLTEGMHFFSAPRAVLAG
jgi:Multiubiquitin